MPFLTLEAWLLCWWVGGNGGWPVGWLEEMGKEFLIAFAFQKKKEWISGGLPFCFFLLMFSFWFPSQLISTASRVHIHTYEKKTYKYEDSVDSSLLSSFDANLLFLGVEYVFVLCFCWKKWFIEGVGEELGNHERGEKCEEGKESKVNVWCVLCI